MWVKRKIAMNILVVLVIITFLMLLSFAVIAHPASAAEMQSVESSLLPWPGGLSSPALQVSSAITLYMPIIYRNPTPPPAPSLFFFDDFSKDNSGWLKGGDSSCFYSYINSRYKVEVKKTNQECWGAGPSQTLKKYGTFETLAFGEGGGNVAYGIYINGSGGNEQYLFIVKPNDSGCGSGKGKYEFYRTKSGSRSLKLSGCSSEVKRGTGSSAENRLTITHTSNGVISIYANGVVLGTYNDSNQLTGEGTGVFAASTSSQNVVRFDHFAIYNP